MNEPVYAAGAAVPPVTASPRRRSRWPGRLLVLLAVGLAIVAALALLVDTMHMSAPVHVTIDGHEVFSGFDMDTLPQAHKVVLAAVALVLLLAAMVIVPVALMMALAAVLCVVLLIVGLPLAAVAFALALVLSPLILLGWLLWKLIAS